MNPKWLTREERRKRGKALRKKCARSAHAAWKLRPSDGVIGILEESNADRIPGLIPVRYGRMSQSPFTFFRATASIQARDLRRSPVSGIEVQACGDCHLMNFGGFATPERAIVFDMSDFDETFPAPWEWDLKRLGASLVLAARSLEFSKTDAEDAVRATAASYRKRMSEFACAKVLDTWYAQIKFEDVKALVRGDKDSEARLAAKTKQARGRTSEAVFPKLTSIVNGRARIRDNPPVIYHFQHNLRNFAKTNARFVKDYLDSLPADRHQLLSRYQFVDAAVKVVGVGSVGTRCFISLWLADDDDPLVLQVKEARRSVLEPPGRKSRYVNQGERVVTGQRLMQAASDIFLGWARIPNGRDYFVRQLRDMKIAAEVETFKRGTLIAYATLCGWATARAHAKAGDASMIAGYLGSNDQFDTALAKYSAAYADQVEQDFKAFKKAIRTGRLKSDTDEAGGLDFLL